ncbi:576_t:CDS:2, partial [Funneliformis caledonium]
MKELKLSKRPLVNVRNSRMTKYRQKVKVLENRKKNGQTLYQLLNNHNTGGSSDGNFGDGSSDSDGSSVDFSGSSFGSNFGSDSFDGKDGSNGNFFGGDSSNSDGSNNDEIWFAHCIRSWAKAFIEYGDISKSNHGKHFRGSSILDDKDVQLKVTSYLQQHKFNTTVYNFHDYISNEILPSVGIEEKTKI